MPLHNLYTRVFCLKSTFIDMVIANGYLLNIDFAISFLDHIPIMSENLYMENV